MDADALREEMPWASRVTLDFLRKALVSFSVMPLPPHTRLTRCSDGAVQVADGGHGDCVVGVVALHGL